MNRRDSVKLMVAAAGSVLLPAGEVALAEATGKHRSTIVPKSGAYAVAPAFTRLKFGEIKPTGWILAQMRRDLESGFAGRLDELCHEASSDIFASARNRPGNSNSGNAANDAWWNGESEGNWRCGHMMLACLTQDPAAMAKANAYVKHILDSQDTDGYIGIFAPELRYQKDGELWTQTCLFRGLLAFADATGNQQVFNAVRRAVDRTLEGYAGVKQLQIIPHDAIYTDVLESLYDKTRDRRYLDFGLRIYRETPHLLEFHRTPIVGLSFQTCYAGGHGPSTAESMRMPFWFWTATGEPEYLKLGTGVLAALNSFALPSGATVSEEMVDAPPHPSNAGYEYCALFERQFSLINAGQKKGDAAYFQAAEHLWLNAAQGSREPDGSAILYCSYENRFSVHDEIGRRQRFSPTHQHIAVCCVPNSTRVAPYFVSSAWMRPAGAEPALAVTLYGPCKVTTEVAGVGVTLEERTTYPYSGDVEITLRPSKPLSFCLWLRDPEWSSKTTISCQGAEAQRVGSFWQLRKKWKEGDTVSIHFHQAIRKVPALDNEFAMQYGPLLYVLAVKGNVETVKTYAQPGFRDYFVTKAEDADTDLALPASGSEAGFGFAPQSASGGNPDYPLDHPSVILTGELVRKDGAPAVVTLVPMGASNAQLRRVTFPVAG